ncbi:hypothetical protein HYALB_00004381 [Hymenoscyphus albidus]|uniref:DUF6314 domain-containing protein n=1 Tax=Hymenoscyphus albidus TaxID=595503 RepID=A0A9N9LG40_9HELO|nr:hypothetical protein HYALB_00004381 [Hymenoscyphus albidus]
MSKAKTVCIIGAGPSGIVAAKTLVHDHPKNTFHVTIFEALDRIGGLWPVSEKDDGIVNPDMCTNQSRHTVSFSGLAWPESTPSFPKAWQVGQYLERYIEKYPGYEIRKNTRVVKADLRDGKWTVQTRKGTKESSEVVDQTHEFDHLIVGTGFFGKAKIPKILEGFAKPVVHSSEVRDIKDILVKSSGSSSSSGKRIVVVGGQMSGVEIAAAIASQLSSAENSPEESSIPNISEYTITHVVQNPLWIMPLFFPKDPVVDVAGSQEKAQNSSPDFLPVDLVAYNLGWKPPGPLQNTSGHISVEAANLTHTFMNTYIGSDQSEYSEHLAMIGEVRDFTPYVTVSDSYHEFVRSGKINTSKGKVLGAGKEAPEGLLLQDGENQSQIDDVAAVVLATGFDASPSLDFFSPEPLQHLQFGPTSDAFPLALNIHSTINKAFPSLGFVGFYRSPYWGVIEMQARYLSALWTGDSKASEALASDTTLESMLALRTDPRRAQFPMGDYAYLMESFSEILSIPRTEPSDSTGRTGLVLPARYVSPTASETEKHEASTALSIIDKLVTDSTTAGKFVARAAFRAMQGDWKLTRKITSRIASYPSGTLTGNAYLKPRAPTDKDADMEYLYLETGSFAADNGLTFTAKRSYVHRYTESTDTLSVWFTKADHRTVDYFFHSLQFVAGSGSESSKTGKEPWKANSSHLCIKDLYDVEYEFFFSGAGLREWSMEYTVRGPAKDYTIRSVYRR